MPRIKTIIGYFLAALALPVVLATFMGLEFWSHNLASSTRITISPWFSGGEVIRTIDHERYQTLIHCPVFDGLLKERKEGFVQVDWAPLSGLPGLIKEDIDFDGDGRKDFLVELDAQAGSAVITPYSQRVINLEGCNKIKEARTIRVLLKRS